MFKITLVVVSVLALMAISSLAGEKTEPSAEIIQEGRQIAEKHCARCHAIGVEGASVHKEAPPFREVVKRYSPWLLAEAFAEGITTGHPDMPAFKFDPEEITSLLSYLESLEEIPAKPDLSGGDVE